MSWSLKLFTVHGIPVRIHITFLLVVAWAAYSGFTAGRADWLQGVGFMVALTLLLFLCVLLHELGHSLVAQLFGVHVADITLWPLGGLARIAKMPEHPYQEFVMTAAGPATNILLVILLSLAALVWLGPGELLTLAASPWLLRSFLSSMSGETLLVMLIANNALLAVFNLIPAFPLDGGRMLRALLAAVMPYRRATAIAAYVGQIFALLLGALALMERNFFLAAIAAFVFLGAWQEREQLRARVNLHGLSVRQAMQPVGLRLHPLQTLGDAAIQGLLSPQTTFLVVDGGRLAGLLPRAELLGALRKAGPAARVGQWMRRDIWRLAPADSLAEVSERLWHAGSAAAAVVIEAGQVVGTLSRADLARLTEALSAYPAMLPRA
ncbi:MAG: Zinc metalloprotease [Chloroflexota bacterium]|nr:Zinc metalloprotease [Chloroflexota bacterium]